jgi:hypothetical protein
MIPAVLGAVDRDARPGLLAADLGRWRAPAVPLDRNQVDRAPTRQRHVDERCQVQTTPALSEKPGRGIDGRVGPQIQARWAVQRQSPPTADSSAGIAAPRSDARQRPVGMPPAAAVDRGVHEPVSEGRLATYAHGYGRDPTRPTHPTLRPTGGAKSGAIPQQTRSIRPWWMAKRVAAARLVTAILA